MKSLAVLLWAIVLVSIWFLAHGDEDAINGVVGGGICAIVATVMAVMER
jgi:hypothetical protein